MGLHINILCLVLLAAVNVDATSKKKTCHNKSRNETFGCYNGYCDSSNKMCNCFSGYHGKNCDKKDNNSAYISETVVGVLILIPAFIWIMIRIYNRKHRITRNSRIRKRSRRPTTRRRTVEEGDNDIDSSETIDDRPPNYTTAMSHTAPSQYPVFIISSNQPNPLNLPSYATAVSHDSPSPDPHNNLSSKQQNTFELPSYEDVLKEKESQESTVDERSGTYQIHQSTPPTWSHDVL